MLYPIVQPDRRFKGPAYKYLRASDKLPEYSQIDPDPICRVHLFLPGSRLEHFIYAATTYGSTPVLTSYCVSPLGPDFNEEGDTALDDILAVRSKVFGLPMEREIGYEPERVSAIRERFSVYA